MRQYHNLLKNVYQNGAQKTDPQGIGNKALFGQMLRYEPAEAFPLITEREISLEKAAGELLWMLSGDTTLEGLHRFGIRWWDSYDTPEVRKIYHLKEGHLGPIYGSQIRHFNGGGKKPVDQLSIVIDSLKKSPDSRRHLITLWNPLEADQVYYAPCITQLKFDHAQGKLSLEVHQRSADVAGGLPFDIAEYALFLLMTAQVTNLEPNELIYFLSDTHIYKDQMDHVKILLARKPKPFPKVKLNPKMKKMSDFLEALPKDFITITGYNPHPLLRIPVSAQ